MVVDSAYTELEDYIADISYEGHAFSFQTNDILDVTYENGKYAVNLCTGCTNDSVNSLQFIKMH